MDIKLTSSTTTTWSFGTSVVYFAIDAIYLQRNQMMLMTKMLVTFLTFNFSKYFIIGNKNMSVFILMQVLIITLGMLIYCSFYDIIRNMHLTMKYV